MSQQAKPHAALILVGHGSTLNPDSSAPTYAHAERLRASKMFGEVACCFWKEEPNMREVFEMVESDVIYIVPNFISEGYFCQEVLPRELRLDGPVTQRGGKTLFYCDPVGVHANMKRLLLQRADEIAPGVPRDQTSLIIVGHGTSLNENSTRAIQEQVRLIRDGGCGFAEVVDAYMEQTPLVAEWEQLTSAPNVVVVPFFIADGLHSYQDIPVLLGIVEETGAALSEGGGTGGNPHDLRGRRLFYSNAIGTEPLLAEVILDQVADFDRRHGIDTAPAVPTKTLPRFLANMTAPGDMLIGEVRVCSAGGGYELRHAADADKTELELEVFAEAEAARSIALRSEDGKFRPLHSAPTLRRGWLLRVPDPVSLQLALDYFHPAALGLAASWQSRTLRATPLREFLGRQTGMYRFANRITDEQAREMVTRICHESNCLRRILWPLEDGKPLDGAAACKSGDSAGFAPGCEAASRLPLLCIEACPFILGEARKLARTNHGSQVTAHSE